MRIIYTITLLIAAALFWTSAFAQSLTKPPLYQGIRIKDFDKAYPLYKEDTVDIVILGDLMMHNLQIQKALQHDGSYDFSSYFQHIESIIQKADIAIGNMEFTLGGKPYSGYPCFSAPDIYAEQIALAGFDIFLCANNHIFDKGGTGASRTLEIYEKLHYKYGILHTGLRTEEISNTENGKATDCGRNNPLFVIRKGIKLAFVNFTYGTNTGSGQTYPKVNRLTDKDLLKATLSKATEADFVIALPHWGNEYVLKPSASQRKDAEFMVAEGVDVIVGSHPHVVQDWERINNVPVIYSVGNAVSNMSAPNTQVELMVKLRFIRENDGDTRMEDPEFVWLWCSRPGGFCNDYTILPIEDFVGKGDLWIGKWDYDKMITSFKRVSDATGIGKTNDK